MPALTLGDSPTIGCQLQLVALLATAVYKAFAAVSGYKDLLALLIDTSYIKSKDCQT